MTAVAQPENQPFAYQDYQNALPAVPDMPNVYDLVPPAAELVPRAEQAELLHTVPAEVTGPVFSDEIHALDETMAEEKEMFNILDLTVKEVYRTHYRRRDIVPQITARLSQLAEAQFEQESLVPGFRVHIQAEKDYIRELQTRLEALQAELAPHLATKAEKEDKYKAHEAVLDAYDLNPESVKAKDVYDAVEEIHQTDTGRKYLVQEIAELMATEIDHRQLQINTLTDIDLPEAERRLAHWRTQRWQALENAKTLVTQIGDLEAQSQALRMRMNDFHQFAGYAVGMLRNIYEQQIIQEVSSEEQLKEIGEQERT